MKRKPVVQPPTVVFADSNGPLLTTEQVAQQLNVGTITVKRRVWRGELKCIYLSPSCVRFQQSEVDAYIASRKS